MKDKIIGVLLTLFVLLLAWGGTTIVGNSQDIVRLDERNKNTKEIVVEIKTEQRIQFQRIDEKLERLYAK